MSNFGNLSATGTTNCEPNIRIEIEMGIPASCSYDRAHAAKRCATPHFYRRAAAMVYAKTDRPGRREISNANRPSGIARTSFGRLPSDIKILARTSTPEPGIARASSKSK
jgi:hypothetical protein